MAKRNNGIPNLEDYKNDTNNKYVRSILLSYFMISRNQNLLESKRIIETQNLWDKLYNEYKKFLANENVQMDIEEENSTLDIAGLAQKQTEEDKIFA